ncbi:mucin/porimin [Holotrichia oblita]|uniref:Mucin/porimin n=1 Tax=Holotrichia oblita TaxID=644536 RepID=A0ACB9SVT5_HOLOL|nr:mucin/porimin [Holotrichia oblita]
MKVLNIRFPFILVVVLISTVRCQDSKKPEAKDDSSTNVGVIINNSTELPDQVTTITVQTVTPDSNTTTPTTTSSTTSTTVTTTTTPTTKSPETTTTPPTTQSPTTKSTTTQPPTKPTKSTTAAPSTTEKPVDPTTTPVPPKDRHFDGASFIGGIILAVGLMGIGFIAFKFYKARTERNYHTL